MENMNAANAAKLTTSQKLVRVAAVTATHFIMVNYKCRDCGTVFEKFRICPKCCSTRITPHHGVISGYRPVDYSKYAAIKFAFIGVLILIGIGIAVF